MTEKDKLRYVIFAAVVQFLFASPGALYMIQQPTTLAVYGIWIAIAVIGILYCFRANQDGDGRNFIERFVCLGAPLFLRWVTAVYGSLIVLWTGWSFFGTGRTLAPTWGSSVYMILMVPLYGLYYLWLRKYIRVAAAGQTAPAFQH